MTKRWLLWLRQLHLCSQEVPALRAVGTRPKPLLMKTLNRKDACPASCCKSSLTNTLLPAVTLGGGLYQNLSKVFCSLRTGASYITEAALSQVDSQSLNNIGSFGNINFGRFAMKFVFMCALFYVTSMN